MAHRLHVENDEKAAIQFITGYDGKAPSPDLFVIDIQMPGANGLAVIRSIRNRSCFSTRPIVLMSNVLSKTEQHYIETIPLCFFFEKPVWLDKWSEIGAFIRTLCDKPTSEEMGS